jgi:membrane protease subunit (stomatin/prohibitin family)
MNNWYKKYKTAKKDYTLMDVISEMEDIYDLTQIDPRLAKMRMLALAKDYFKGGKSIRNLKHLILEAAKKARDNYKETQRILSNVIHTLYAIHEREAIKDDGKA